jgi:WD40 repeat protein
MHWFQRKLVNDYSVKFHLNFDNNIIIFYFIHFIFRDKYNFNEMKYSSTSLNKLVQLQQSVKNASVKSFSAHNSKIHSVAWNVDGRRLASGSTDKTVAIFTFENREKLVNSIFYFENLIFKVSLFN